MNEGKLILLLFIMFQNLTVKIWRRRKYLCSVNVDIDIVKVIRLGKKGGKEG